MTIRLPEDVRDEFEALSMTVNLQARDDFDKGDIGHVIGHRVSKATQPVTLKGSNLVTALQEVKAGTNAWFEVR